MGESCPADESRVELADRQRNKHLHSHRSNDCRRYLHANVATTVTIIDELNTASWIAHSHVTRILVILGDLSFPASASLSGSRISVDDSDSLTTWVVHRREMSAPIAAPDDHPAGKHGPAVLLKFPDLMLSVHRQGAISSNLS